MKIHEFVLSPSKHAIFVSKIENFFYNFIWFWSYEYFWKSIKFIDVKTEKWKLFLK